MEHDSISMTIAELIKIKSHGTYPITDLKNHITKSLAAMTGAKSLTILRV